MVALRLALEQADRSYRRYFIAGPQLLDVVPFMSVKAMDVLEDRAIRVRFFPPQPNCDAKVFRLELQRSSTVSCRIDRYSSTSVACSKSGAPLVAVLPCIDVRPASDLVMFEQMPKVGLQHPVAGGDMARIWRYAPSPGHQTLAPRVPGLRLGSRTAPRRVGASQRRPRAPPGSAAAADTTVGVRLERISAAWRRS